MRARRSGRPALWRSLVARIGDPATENVRSADPLPACPPDRLTDRWERQRALWRGLSWKVETCAAAFRRVAGMPDYAAYLRHLQAVHPDWPVPSEREYFALYVESRYGNGPSRCC